MGAVWLRLRAELRQQRPTWLALTLLLGLIGGVALTAAAGARRTDTAYPRLLRHSRAADLLISPAVPGFTGYFGALARLPQVASVGVTVFLDMSPARHPSPYPNIVVEASPNGVTGSLVDRVRIVSGRMFDAADPRAVMIDEQLARAEHLRPGSILRLIGYPQERNRPDVVHAARLAFRVSAIVSFDDQIVPATSQLGDQRALLSPAFARTAAARSFNPGAGGAYVVLRPGARMASVIARATGPLARRYQAGRVSVVNLATEYAATERAIRPEAAALAIFAGLAGVIGLVIIAQLLSRQLLLDAAEFPVLRALGMSRRRLEALSLARPALVTISGGVAAVGTAIAASPLMPIGPARIAEPSPGAEVNLAILGAGFAVIAVLPLALVAPAAWRAAARAGGPLGVAEQGERSRGSRPGPVPALAGSVPGSVGVRMAFEPGHGRTAVPVRSALTGTAVAVAAVVAAVVFGASFIGLVSSPHRYGQNWPQQLDLQVGAVPGAMGGRILAAVPGVSGYAGGDYGQVGIGRMAVPAIGIDQLRGRGFLTMLAGTAPSGPREIVLGARTMAAARLRLGQTVRVSVNGRERAMRIVGSAVFAAFSVAGGSATDLGTGAGVAASVLSAPNPPGCTARATCYNFFLVRYRPGTDLKAAADRLQRAVAAAGCPPGLCLVTTDQRPLDIRNYAGVRDTPLVLGGVLALLAAGTLTHALLTGVRRRRRDLAVLKTLGLRRLQVLQVVVWQASALAAAALLAGLPAGVIAGRWAWDLFARSVGVASRPDVPVPLVLLVIPVTLALANLVAAGPGWAAARIRPALILRAE